MNAPLHLSPAAVARLTLDTDPWLSCDDCFERLDEAVEDVLVGAPLSPPFAAHLRGCPACAEEARSLTALVAPELGLTAMEALTRLDGACAARLSR
jgi:hypothetical protein